MIEIRFETMRMTATGHAGYAPYGEDIVCAGISSLLAAAAQTMGQMQEAGLLDASKAELRPGYALLEMQPSSSGWGAAAAIMAMLENGCRLIADRYSQYVVIHGAGSPDA